MTQADPERALTIFEDARSWARHGAALDAGCGECCLYEFGATARIATTSGILSSLGEVRELGPLADRCLADPPTWQDDAVHTEEGNLYFGLAQYFRLLPDSALVKAIIGRRRDLPRATELARMAVATTPERVDYRVELGTLLLCSGEEEGDGAALAEGRQLLRSVEGMPDQMRTDAEDRARAQWLIGSPEEACLSGRNVKTD